MGLVWGLDTSTACYCVYGLFTDFVVSRTPAKGDQSVSELRGLDLVQSLAGPILRDVSICKTSCAVMLMNVLKAEGWDSRHTDRFDHSICGLRIPVLNGN
jgi:hypothetical protein